MAQEEHARTVIPAVRLTKTTSTILYDTHFLRQFSHSFIHQILKARSDQGDCYTHLSLDYYRLFGLPRFIIAIIAHLSEDDKQLAFQGVDPQNPQLFAGSIVQSFDIKTTATLPVIIVEL